MATMANGLTFYPYNSFDPVVVYSIEQWQGMTSFLVSRDFRGCASSLLDEVAPGYGDIAEAFCIEASLAGDGCVKMYEAMA